MDQNGDGALDEAEVALLARSQDGTRYDPALTAQGQLPVGPPPRDAAAARDLVRFIAAEIHARDPSVPVPDEAAINADGGEVRALMAQLRTGCATVGIVWPASLDAELRQSP